MLGRLNPFAVLNVLQSKKDDEITFGDIYNFFKSIKLPEFKPNEEMRIEIELQRERLQIILKNMIIETDNIKEKINELIKKLGCYPKNENDLNETYSLLQQKLLTLFKNTNETVNQILFFKTFSQCEITSENFLKEMDEFDSDYIFVFKSLNLNELNKKFNGLSSLIVSKEFDKANEDMKEYGVSLTDSLEYYDYYKAIKNLEKTISEDTTLTKHEKEASENLFAKTMECVKNKKISPSELRKLTKILNATSRIIESNNKKQNVNDIQKKEYAIQNLENLAKEFHEDEIVKAAVLALSDEFKNSISELAQNNPSNSGKLNENVLPNQAQKNSTQGKVDNHSHEKTSAQPKERNISFWEKLGKSISNTLSFLGNSLFLGLGVLIAPLSPLFFTFGGSTTVTKGTNKSPNKPVENKPGKPVADRTGLSTKQIASTLSPGKTIQRPIEQEKTQTLSTEPEPSIKESTVKNTKSCQSTQQERRTARTRP